MRYKDFPLNKLDLTHRVFSLNVDLLLECVSKCVWLHDVAFG